MKVKEMKDLLSLFEDRKYDDYNIVFWDYARQKAMDGHFGGLSHPEKEISIPISVVGEEYTPKVEVNGLPAIIPSPFVEGKNAYLHKNEDANLSGIKYTRYFYVCEATGNQFDTTSSSTFSMCEYYCEECKRLKNLLKEKGVSVKEMWEKIGTDR